MDPPLSVLNPSFLGGLLHENRALYALIAGCPPRLSVAMRKSPHVAKSKSSLVAS